ncbi:hypothetical protein A3D07_01580 [Candidatus Curtissbacteria bacterium RIFCSPHIGHO2_02_FULL_42_15]|uniref:Uncharacterized protein n=1 Tax=Candidatus Curtissbacteria bacterium RIFCSPHIGHO2_02_FULL_42_15 TaxID=1797716 RepID=A0A1F5GFL8_9BACT|nr:MAG: hypothetical protein A3D07_01580 [Candidatus Curtissbacteria bacterium RIFCSPHIGHO2_02_FULL_42_15]
MSCEQLKEDLYDLRRNSVKDPDLTLEIGYRIKLLELTCKVEGADIHDLWEDTRDYAESLLKQDQSSAA